MANQPLSGSNDSPGMGAAFDMLGKLENQVGSIVQSRSTGHSASPSASQADEELDRLREELLSADQQGYRQLAEFAQALEDLKQAIPALIDEAAHARFLEIEEAFHRNMKEIHSRGIEAFIQTAQSKVGQRIAALETNLSIHTEAMGQLREHYLKTDRNVQRLMAGVDRLTAELMRVSSGAPASPPRPLYTPAVRAARPAREARENVSETAIPREEPAPAAEAGPDSTPALARVRSRRRKQRNTLLAVVVALVILLPLCVLGGYFWFRGAGVSIAAKREGTPPPPLPTSGTEAQLRMAADLAAEKNYAKAESIYRGILRTEPSNREAIKELASVLFRQQRYDEAAAVLKTLPPEH